MSDTAERFTLQNYNFYLTRASFLAKKCSKKCFFLHFDIKFHFLIKKFVVLFAYSNFYLYLCNRILKTISL